MAAPAPPPPAPGAAAPATAAPSQTAPAVAAPAGATKPGIEERLQKLDDLRKKQLLTEDEYKKKREELLKEL
jgi:hypothetical protein